MELIISQEDFAAAIATPLTAVKDIYDRCEPFFPAATSQLEKSINYQVANIDASLADPVKQVVYLMAFYNCIPHLALI